jgi:hypothetical protein
MQVRTLGRVVGSLVVVALAATCMNLSLVHAGTGGGTGSGGGTAGGMFTVNGTLPAGVLITAEGVLQNQVFGDPGGMLSRQRYYASRAALPADLRAFSVMRKISLNRLEQALKARNNQPTDEMRYLAGLLRVRYVFFYPESGDIVLAGPAEGWMTDPLGRVISLTTMRPVLQLQDLVVALRAFPPGQKNLDKSIGCSIDPTKEGLAAMQQFLRQIGSHATPGDTEFIVTGLKNRLGMQTVSISGVSGKTNFARVMVEADYRMKLIGIGLE